MLLSSCFVPFIMSTRKTLSLIYNSATINVSILFINNNILPVFITKCYWVHLYCFVKICYVLIT